MTDRTCAVMVFSGAWMQHGGETRYHQSPCGAPLVEQPCRHQFPDDEVPCRSRENLRDGHLWHEYDGLICEKGHPG